MSALALILTAAMAVPGDGPEKMPGEISHKRLDLRGRWELVYDGRFSASEIMSGKQWLRALRIQDLGEGKLRMALPTSYKDDLVFIPCTATYCQESDRVVIYFRIVEGKKPIGFYDNINQSCLIFERVKSRE